MGMRERMQEACRKVITKRRKKLKEEGGGNRSAFYLFSHFESHEKDSQTTGQLKARGLTDEDQGRFLSEIPKYTAQDYFNVDWDHDKMHEIIL